MNAAIKLPTASPWEIIFCMKEFFSRKFIHLTLVWVASAIYDRKSDTALRTKISPSRHRVYIFAGDLHGSSICFLSCTLNKHCGHPIELWNTHASVCLMSMVYDHVLSMWNVTNGIVYVVDLSDTYWSLKTFMALNTDEIVFDKAKTVQPDKAKRCQILNSEQSDLVPSFRNGLRNNTCRQN